MKHTSRTRAFKLIAACSVALTFLAACGSGGSSGGGSDTVNVGLLEPLSGPFADNGNQALLGTQLCTDQINAAGGIKALGGAKINLVVKDTGAAAPAQVANQLQSMIGTGDLSAVIGAFASSYTLAASTVAEQAKIPMVTESFAGDITKRNYRYIFKTPATAESLGLEGVNSVLELAKKSGYDISRAATIADNTSSTTVSANGAADQLTKRGVNVVVKESFSPGLTEADSLAIKVLAGNPQLIFVGGGLADMALLINAFKQRGYTGPLLGAGGGFVATGFAKAVGKAAEGSFSSSGWNWDLPGESNKQFAADFTAKNPQFPFPGQEAGEDCAAVRIIAQAMEEAKSSKPQAVRDALSSINITSGPAIMLSSGAVSFDESGNLKGAVPVIVQWQDGKPRTVAPEKLANTPVVPFGK